MCIYSFFKFFSQLVCYRLLSRVPCAGQQTLIHFIQMEIHFTHWLSILNRAVCTCQFQTPYFKHT